MRKERKIIKLNQEEILSIISEHFNDSGNKYVFKQVYETNFCLFGSLNKDFRLVCVLSNDENDEEIFNLNLSDLDKKFDFTGNKSVSLILDK